MSEETKILTCIRCPVGCQLTATMTQNEVVDVSGNLCKRGVKYAKTECVNPLRVLTTTVRVAGGAPLSVRSVAALPKAQLFHCMRLINEVTLQAGFPVAVGDIIVANIADTGVDMIATSSRLV